MKEDLAPKMFGPIFAKIPQEPTQDAALKQDILREAHFPHAVELGLGCTNQIAKVIKSCEENNTETRESYKNVNLPLANRQSFDKYKVLVALAPPMVKFGDKNKPLIVYIVFAEDGTNGFNPINIPSVYFVNKINNEEKVPVDPIFIIDNNRTVTGLKSKEISRYITFRNKLINIFDNKKQAR